MEQFWSILSMPIGLFLCFTPVLIAWIIQGRKDRQAEQSQANTPRQQR